MLTIRDEIAIRFAQNYYSNSTKNITDETFTDVAKSAYQMADALLKVRDEENLTSQTKNEPVFPPNVWIVWDGKSNISPIPNGVKHQVRFRDDRVSGVDMHASTWRWVKSGQNSDVVEFKIIE